MKGRVPISSGSHGVFHFVGGVGQCRGQFDQLAAGVDVIHVFDSHSQLFFWNINAGFDGEDHARRKRNVVVAGVVDIQADVVAEAVDEILP